MSNDDVNAVFGAKRSNYFELKDFEAVFLEDSFVLEIIDGISSVTFLVDLILAKNHPLWMKPKKGEAYYYKKAEIFFPAKKRIDWIEKKMISSRDLDGEIDFGNIDYFFRRDDKYYLEGNWGKVIIESSKPIIKFI